MNKLKNYGSILIILFTFLFSSCTNIIEDKTPESNEKAYISLSTDSAYRTIMPSYKPFENLKFVLKGRLNGNEEKTIGSWDSYSQMQFSSNNLIEITTGNWQFSLYAKNGEFNVLSSTINKQIINGVNTLSFDMSEVYGTGKIKVDLSIPINSAEKITAGLFTLNNQPVESFEEEELVITNSSRSNVSYLKQDVLNGVYILRFFFYQNADDSLPVNTYSSIVRVSAGYESTGNLEVNQINHFYTINYEMDFAQFKEGFVAPLNFNEYMQIDLPTQADFPEEFQFHGWYEKNNEDKGYVDKIEKGTKADKTFVCDSVLYVSWNGIKSVIQKYNIPSDKLLKVKIKKSTDYSTMENIVGYKIALDLSECDFTKTPSFNSCICLNSILLPSSVTSISSSAFYGCSSLTSVNIPDGVTSIGNSAFYGCSSLISVNIPDGVTSIERSTFSNCKLLTSIDIPDGVTSIGVFAFEDCSSLTSVNIPDGVTSIDSAFSGCSSLTSVNIPDSVTSIDSAFKNCSSLTSVNIPDDVTSIGSVTFAGCKLLTSIDIPDGVTSIGDFAFSGCSSLTSVNIPDGVTSIGVFAFEDCKSLTSVNIPDGVTSIGSVTFSGCSSLTSIDIPDGVTSIGVSAFQDCSSLTSVNIPDGVTSIGDSAFGGCSSLISLNIPDGVTSIGDSAFKNCSSLTSINIPDGVTSIGDSAFKNCSSLTSINIPDGVTSIGDSAFNNCRSMISVNIPDGVTSIGSNTFIYCKLLTSINIPDGVTSIGVSAFSFCSSLTSIEIPDGVTSIGDFAFSACSSLTSIEIPDGVTSIGKYAFKDIPHIYYHGSASGSPWGAKEIN